MRSFQLLSSVPLVDMPLLIRNGAFRSHFEFSYGSQLGVTGIFALSYNGGQNPL